MLGARRARDTSSLLALATIGVLGLVATAVPSAHAAPACTRYAAPGGSDSASGSASAPYRSAQKLQDSLAPGEVGCLAPGATFSERLRGNRGGQPGRPITMTSGPGNGRATLLGELFVPDGTSDIVYTDLIINGRTSFRVNPSINGDRITFSNNEITDENHGICFHLGKPGEGVAEDIVIDGNRIHNCGRLPATGFDHGIYLNTTRNVRITNNYIYDNADYGVHLYPDAQGTLVANNVIDGNGRGVTFSGEGSTASSNNVVTNNIISNSSNTSNIESYWGGPVGSGNRAEGNCLWNGAKGNIGTQTGFAVSNNLSVDPLFANRSAKDFSLRPGSPCAGKGPGSALSPQTPGPSFRSPDSPFGGAPPTTGPTAPGSGPNRSRARARDRSMSQPLTRGQRAAGPTAAPTRRQVVIHRRMVLTLMRSVTGLERRAEGRSSLRIPRALRSSSRSVAGQLRVSRWGAAESLRRVTILLNDVRGRKAVPLARTRRAKVRPTVGQMRATERLARAATRRARTLEGILP